MSASSLPLFLASPEAFSTHLYEQFEDSTNQEKGDKFLDFAMTLVTFVEEWKSYPVPTPSPKKTHDKGVDFCAISDDGGSWLCGQSKFRIREISDIDEIVSKFQNYEAYVRSAEGNAQRQLFAHEEKTPRGRGTRDGGPELIFVVVTPVSVQGLLERYRKSSLTGRKYFAKLEEDNRIAFLDRDRALPILRRVYRQNYVPDPEIDIWFSSDIIQVENVLLSTVSGKALRELYERHGSSLFFENIREFLGVPQAGKSGKGDDDAVNAEILTTLNSAPQKMLSRNNGITVKAEKILQRDRRGIRASRCSIVNGCQTTMCVVQAGESADDAQIVIKVVEGGDPWDIAKAANYQNRVTRLELELAEFLRPQLVRKAATDMGHAFERSEEQQTVSNLLYAVHNGRVSYEFIRILYLGVFSRSPKNMFNSNYSEVRIDVLRRFANEDDEVGDTGNQLLRVLFELMIVSQDAVRSTEQRLKGAQYESHFRRFFDDARPKYQGIVTIIAACASTGVLLTDKSPDTEEAYLEIRKFVLELERIFAQSKEYYKDVFAETFMIIADRVLVAAGDSDSNIRQDMYNATESAASSEAFKRIVGSIEMRIQAHKLKEKYQLL